LQDASSFGLSAWGEIGRRGTAFRARDRTVRDARHPHGSGRAQGLAFLGAFPTSPVRREDAKGLAARRPQHTGVDDRDTWKGPELAPGGARRAKTILSKPGLAGGVRGCE